MRIFTPRGLVLDSGINGKMLSHANFFLPYLTSHPKPLFYEATTKLWPQVNWPPTDPPLLTPSKIHWKLHENKNKAYLNLIKEEITFTLLLLNFQDGER